MYSVTYRLNASWPEFYISAAKGVCAKCYVLSGVLLSKCLSQTQPDGDNTIPT